MKSKILPQQRLFSAENEVVQEERPASVGA